jgi:hypothetical protein
MLPALHALTARIARENPDDQDAQLAADKAARDLEDAFADLEGRDCLVVRLVIIHDARIEIRRGFPEP